MLGLFRKRRSSTFYWCLVIARAVRSSSRPWVNQHNVWKLLGQTGHWLLPARLTTLLFLYQLLYYFCATLNLQEYLVLKISVLLQGIFVGLNAFCAASDNQHHLSLHSITYLTSLYLVWWTKKLLQLDQASISSILHNHQIKSVVWYSSLLDAYLLYFILLLDYFWTKISIQDKLKMSRIWWWLVFYKWT